MPLSVAGLLAVELLVEQPPVEQQLVEQPVDLRQFVLLSGHHLPTVPLAVVPPVEMLVELVEQQPVEMLAKPLVEPLFELAAGQSIVLAVDLVALLIVLPAAVEPHLVQLAVEQKHRNQPEHLALSTQ